MTAVPKTNIVRVPKAGEMIATELRRQIVLGELAEGDALPSETALMERFGVSRPTLREAFRILESERLIGVRRGAHGGARVLVPDNEVAARYAGLLLQYRKATITDVYEARTQLETLAVSALAVKPSAATIKAIAAALAEGESLLTSPAGYAAHDVRFHQLLVSLHGNQTLEILTGMLYHIIDAHHRAYVASHHDVAVAVAAAKTAQRAHAKLLDLIRAREVTQATEFWRKHLKQVTAYMTREDVPEIIDILP